MLNFTTEIATSDTFTGNSVSSLNIMLSSL